MKTDKNTWRVADVSNFMEGVTHGFTWVECSTLEHAMTIAADLMDNGAKQIEIAPPGTSIHETGHIQIDARDVEMP